MIAKPCSVLRLCESRVEKRVCELHFGMVAVLSNSVTHRHHGKALGKSIHAHAVAIQWMLKVFSQQS